MPPALMVSLHALEPSIPVPEATEAPPRPTPKPVKPMPMAPVAEIVAPEKAAAQRRVDAQPVEPKLPEKPEIKPEQATQAYVPEPQPEPQPEPVKPVPAAVTETVSRPQAMASPLSAPSAPTASGPQAVPSEVAPKPISVVPPRFDADYLHNPPPAYPHLSRRLREQGRVLLRVMVSAEGLPGQIEIRESSGYPRLDQAAQASVQRWRFVPARQGELAVPAWVLVPISYSIRS